jgi:hypothetical protein
MRKTARCLGLALGFAAGGLPAAAEDGAQRSTTFFEEAKITVDERARADGFLRVRIVPETGETREATLDIPKRMSENDLAKGMAEALEPVLRPDYEVDRDAGEHVKIRKAERGAPNFSVEITFNAPGFAIILDN